MSRAAADLHHGLYLASFGPLADPHALVEVAGAADDARTNGVFLWDHVLRPTESVRSGRSPIR